MASVITRRNMWLQVLWMLLTFGLYMIYWYHVTCREMCDHLRRDEPVWLWTLLWIAPPLSLYSYYKQGELIEEVTAGNVNRWLIFGLWFFFPPGVWFAIQYKLNELAKKAELAALQGVKVAD